MCVHCACICMPSILSLCLNENCARTLNTRCIFIHVCVHPLDKKYSMSRISSWVQCWRVCWYSLVAISACQSLVDALFCCVSSNIDWNKSITEHFLIWSFILSHTENLNIAHDMRISTLHHNQQSPNVLVHYTRNREQTHFPHSFLFFLFPQIITKSHTLARPPHFFFSKSV